MSREPAPYPSNLRALRGAAHLTRDDLARLASDAAKEDPASLRAPSVSALEKLEAGTSRPRPATARAIALVLGATIDEVFPHGTLAADFTPNPAGKTRVPPKRNTRGAAKKKPPSEST